MARKQDAVKARQIFPRTMNREMQLVIDRAQALVDATAGELDAKIKAARDSLQENLESARSGYVELENRLADTVQVADEFVREKPYQVIGGTFLAGLLLGWFMSRK
jgi:ElaB/YqjD/DUF883 family membrane-anchored ribosome-binding protein